LAENNFDIVVIGAGPGGYVAAIKAAQLGYNVACVEEQFLGGVCLNIGCIPTKALLESAAMITHLGHAKEFGVEIGELKTSMAQAVKRSRQVSERLVKGIGFLFQKNKVTHLAGRGRIAGKGKVEVTDKDGKKQTVQAKHVIIATGSRPRDLPFLKIDHERVWDSTDAMMSQEAPKTLAVVGAGAIGMEFADVYAAFGTKVTIIEAMDRVLPLEDRDCSAVVEKSYKKRGMEVYTGAHIVGPHATELIAEFVIGRHLETTMEEMDRAMHPHPTLSEAVAEAALASLGHPLHM
jgi:dihydrolipoamide dehydrogenase